MDLTIYFVLVVWLSSYKGHVMAVENQSTYKNQSLCILNGTNLTITNEITVNKENCSDHEVEVHILKQESSMHGRLAVCAKLKDWTTDWTSIGFINDETRKQFKLTSVTLKCSLNDSFQQFTLHSKLTCMVAIPKAATFQLEFMLICTRSDSHGSKIRHDAGSYHISDDTCTKDQTSSTTIQKTRSPPGKTEEQTDSPPIADQISPRPTTKTRSWVPGKTEEPTDSSSTAASSGGSVSTAGIVVGIFLALLFIVIFACCYKRDKCDCRRKIERRIQQQGTVAHPTVPPQEMMTDGDHLPSPQQQDY